MRDITFRVGGIDCAACVERLNRLVEVRGVTEFTVNAVNSHAHIQYDETVTSCKELEKQVRRLGYSVSTTLIRIGLETPLPAEILQELRKMEGVKSVTCQSQPIELTIDCMDIGIQSGEFLTLLHQRGIAASLLDISGGDEEKVLADRVSMLRRMAVAVILTMPLMWNPAPIIQFILASVLQFWPNLYFYKGAWKSLRSRSLNMDSLIAISTTAIYLYSSFITFTETESIQLYFLGQGVLSSIIFLGKYMEILVKGEAGQTIKELLRLQPQTAVVLRGQEKVTIDVADIREGEQVWLREGEHIPTDGTVEEGRCTVNESMLTGESLPISKGPGDEVYGGTYNCDGSVVYRAHHLGAASRLQQIVAIVEKAQLTKAPIQSMADKAAAWFIPAVLAIGVGTFLVWYFVLTNRDLAQSIMTMCGVLVIACPCALGLAAPTGMMVGSTCAAEQGILYRGADQIEKAQNITDVVFDKTGTLTLGHMAVGEIISLAEMEPDELLRYAAALETWSKHPIARSIVDAARAKSILFEDLACADIQTFSNGILGMIGEHMVVCGNQRFLTERSVAPVEVETDTTAVWIGLDGKAVGIICLSDELRENAKETVDRLKAQGMTVWLVTGDRKPAATTVANALGIDHIAADVTPAEKGHIITELQFQGKRVAMIGDGINDAPALTVSDLSIAIGSGTAIAVEASDIILLGSDVFSVCSVFSISAQILRVIRQNFLWAIFYNAVSIPLACAGIVNPSIASAAMSFSSIFVLLRSLKLKKLVA